MPGPTAYAGRVGGLESAYATPRVAAGVLFHQGKSRVLMLRTTYKDYWEIPGGYVQPGESPRQAAHREVAEELGIDVPVGRLLVVDWAPSEQEGDKLNFVFDGGELPAGTEFTFADGEISLARYVNLDEVDEYTVPRLARRIHCAAHADQVRYLEHGVPAGS